MVNNKTNKTSQYQTIRTFVIIQYSNKTTLHMKTNSKITNCQKNCSVCVTYYFAFSITWVATDLIGYLVINLGNTCVHFK